MIIVNQIYTITDLLTFVLDHYAMVVECLGVGIMGEADLEFYIVVFIIVFLISWGCYGACQFFEPLYTEKSTP